MLNNRDVNARTIEQDIDVLDAHIETLYPRHFNKDGEYENNNLPDDNLFWELVKKRTILALQLNNPKKIFTIASTPAETVHRGLVWLSVLTISGFIIGIIRDLANIFSPIKAAVMVFTFSLINFITQGILTLWDLTMIVADKLTGQNKIERPKSKILTGFISLALIIFGLLIVAKVAVIAGVASPFIIPGIFLSLTGLNLYQENRNLKSILKKIDNNAQEIKNAENKLKSAFNKNGIKELKDKFLKLQLDNLVPRETLRIQFKKELYDNEEVYSAAKVLHSAKKEAGILKIKKRFSEKKRKALIMSIVFTCLLITGVGITFVLPPLGLLVSGIGLSMLGAYFNSHRKTREEENDKLKKYEKDHEFDSIEILELIKDRENNYEYEINQDLSEKKDHSPLPQPEPEPTKDSFITDVHQKALSPSLKPLKQVNKSSSVIDFKPPPSPSRN